MTVPSGLYVALGDSMSIDPYPQNDAWARWSESARGLGAAALLARNDRLWWNALR